jgi:hypothetical protein
MAISIGVALFYPDFRGIRKGDSVALSSGLPFFSNKLGVALTSGRKNGEIKVKFENGEEAVAVIEDYAGLITPPRVKILYQEKLNE